VEEHLTECGNCRAIAENLKNTYIDEQLIQEKNHVLESHLKREKRKTFTVGLCFAGIFMIPVIVCLICNLAIGHALDWFFIVLASLLVAASLIVVPLVVPKEYIGLSTLGGFTASLLLLLMVVCIYAHGSWFFLAAVPTFFGLSVVFMPYVVTKLALPKPLSQHKGLMVMIWDTVWLFAVIVVCGFHAGSPSYWRVSLTITSFCSLLPWVLFMIIRYFRIHPLIKAGLSFIICGSFIAFVNDVVHIILRDWDHLSIKDTDFFSWDFNSPALNANIYMIVLVLSVVTGIVLIGIGIRLQRKGNA